MRHWFWLNHVVLFLLGILIYEQLCKQINRSVVSCCVDRSESRSTLSVTKISAHRSFVTAWFYHVKAVFEIFLDLLMSIYVSGGIQVIWTWFKLLALKYVIQIIQS